MRANELELLRASGVEPCLLMDNGGKTGRLPFSEAALALRPGVDMLINSDFRNPVNQRGETTYTGTGHTIDSWQLNVSRGTLTVNDGYITLTNTEDSGAEYLRQVFDHAFKSGDVLTLSWLIRGNGNGQIFFGNQETGANIGIGTTNFTASADWQLIVSTITVGSTLPGVAIVQITGKGLYIDILADKMEHGPISTLAHKEGDTWVLNDPAPNEALELLKCQRYQVVYPLIKNGNYWIAVGRSSTQAMLSVSLPSSVRSNPSLTF